MTEQQGHVVADNDREDVWEQGWLWHDEEGRRVIYDDALEAQLQRDYVRLKRPPWRPEDGFGPKDVVIKSRSPQIMLLKVTKAMLEEDPHSCVTLHATGRAITKAIDLALHLQQIFQGALEIAPRTLTIHCVDDWVPNDPFCPSPRLTCTRLVSAIRLGLSFSESLVRRPTTAPKPPK